MKGYTVNLFLLWQRPNRLNIPEPNNQIAAGTGTAATEIEVISSLGLKNSNGPLSIGVPPMPSSIPRDS